MKYKTIIQFVFGIFFLIIIFFFYYKYFSSSKGALITEITESVSSNSEIIQSQNNLIKDMSYETTDDQGNKYLIYSEYGEVNADEPDIILMKNVVAKIQLFEKDTIYINSLSAKYNIINYETNFNKDVQLSYLDHEVFAENIDLSFQKNFVWLNTNVIYRNLDYELFADKIEIDLITKNSKIFTNESKKVKIIKK